MTVKFITAVTATTGSTSMMSLPMTIPSTLSPGDLMLFVGSNERVSVIPTITSPTPGFTQLNTPVGVSTNLVATHGWKRLTADDIGAQITMNVTASRRMAMGASFYSGAADPSFVVGPYYGGSGTDFTYTTPAFTPTQSPAVAVGMISLAGIIEPWQRTFTASTGWTERVEVGSQSTTAINAYAYLAGRTLSGGAGVEQTGLLITDQAGGRAVSFGTTAILNEAPPSVSETGNFEWVWTGLAWVEQDEEDLVYLSGTGWS